MCPIIKINVSIFMALVSGDSLMCQFRKTVMNKHVECNASTLKLVNRQRKGQERHFAVFQGSGTRTSTKNHDPGYKSC